MAAPLLASTSIVRCPHGGFVNLQGPVNPRLRIGGAPAVAPGLHPVFGCGFELNGQFTPCLQVFWAGDSARLSSGGARLIIKVETGVCLGAGNIDQGNPVLDGGQNRVFGF